MAIASFRAGETISAGNAVYVGANNFIYKASAYNFTQASVAGLALDSASAGSLVRVDLDGVFSQSSGLTPGQYHYISPIASGVFVDYATFATQLETISTDAYLSNVGRALSTTSISIEADLPQFIFNPRSVLMLESSSLLTVDAILLEDGSDIDLETTSA